MYEKFEKLMRDKQVKAADVSRATGITTTTLSAWKKGRYEPKADKVQKIADFFGVPVSYFYDEEEEYYIDPETAKLAEELASNPGMRILFDAARDVPAESLKAVAQMLEQFKKTNPEG